MKRFTIFCVLAFVGLIVVPAAVIADPAGPPDGLDVNVINQPLNVVVTNTQTTTKAQQDGTWNVGITNNEENPIPIEVINYYPREPYNQRATKDMLIDDGFFGPWFTCPENKLVVIESISVDFHGDALEGETNTAPYNVSARTDTNFFFGFPMTKQDASYTHIVDGKRYDRVMYVGAHSFRLYADESFQIRVYRTKQWTTTAFVDINVSGYTIPIDSPSLAP